MTIGRRTTSALAVIAVAASLAFLSPGDSSAAGEFTSVGEAAGPAQTQVLTDFLAITSPGSPFGRVYEVTATGFQEPASQPPTGIAGAATAVAVSPAQDYIAFSNAGDPQLAVYELTNGLIGDEVPEPVGSFPLAGVATDVAWSPDGAFIAVTTSSDPYFHVWRWDAGLGEKLPRPTVIPEPPAPQDPFPTPPFRRANVVRWSNGGDFVAFGWEEISGEDPGVVLFEWDDGFGDLVETQGLPGLDVTALAWSPEDDFLAIGRDSDPFGSSRELFVYAFDPVSGPAEDRLMSLPNVPDHVNGVAWHPDGDFLAAATHDVIGGQSLRVWPFDSAAETFGPEVTAPSVSLPGDLTAVSWNSDGMRLAATSTGGAGAIVYDWTGSFGADTQPAAPLPVGGTGLGWTSAVDSPPLPVIFVHGFGGNANQVGFSDLFNILSEDFDDPLVFLHYQDVASVGPSGCASIPFIPRAVGTTISVDATPTNPVNLCDSFGDVGLNAILLWHELEAISADNGGSEVVVVANSMGGAIARGAMAYGTELHSLDASSPAPAAVIDSVMFLQPAIDGSYLAEFADDIDRLAIADSLFSQNPFYDAVTGFALDEAQFVVNRPAVDDLIPGSLWYQYANGGGLLPNEVAFYNVASDIQYGFEACIFRCVTYGLESFGDLVMLPGTDDPFDVPDGGGARFLKGAPGPDQWQYLLGQTEGYRIGWKGLTGGINLSNLGIGFLEAPDIAINHFNFGDRMDAITVSDCSTGSDTALNQSLANILIGRVTGTPYCDGS